MKETLISFETAKLAKEKGFLEPCFHYFTLNGDEKYFREDGMYFLSIGANGRIILRPTQSLLQKWLRENHSIFVAIKTDTSVNEILGFEVRLKSWKFPPIYLDFFKDYEEALEAGLYESLKQAIESPK